MLSSMLLSYGSIALRLLIHLSCLSAELLRLFLSFLRHIAYLH
jgi:hypothetical protein